MLKQPLVLEKKLLVTLHVLQLFKFIYFFFPFYSQFFATGNAFYPTTRYSLGIYTINQAVERFKFKVSSTFQKNENKY